MKKLTPRGFAIAWSLFCLALWILVTAFWGTPPAFAASTTLTIVVNGPPSTAVSCPLQSYTAPLAAGAVVCAITVAPNTWSGVLSLTGTDAAKFTLSGTNLTVGTAALQAGSYQVTVTSTP